MLRILHDTKYDFIKYWKVAAIVTIAWIVVGLGFLAIHGVRYSIEFTGGTLMQLQFRQPPKIDDIRSTVDQAGFRGAEITQFGSATEYTVRAQAHDGVAAVTGDSTAKHIEAALRQRYGDAVSVLRSEFVGPRVGAELRYKAMIAVLISFAVTLIYLAVRFEWRFGLAAIIATAHDVLTTLAFLAMLRLGSRLPSLPRSSRSSGTPSTIRSSSSIAFART